MSRDQSRDPRIEVTFYESEIAPENLFIIDHRIKIMSWIKYGYSEVSSVISRHGIINENLEPLSWGAQRIPPRLGKQGIVSEVLVRHADIVPHTEYESEERSIPMLRELSFDTEAYGHDDRFPIPRWTHAMARKLRKDLVEVKGMPTDPLIAFTVKDTFTDDGDGDGVHHFVYAYEGSTADMNELQNGLIRAQNSNAWEHEMEHASLIVPVLDALGRDVEKHATSDEKDDETQQRWCVPTELLLALRDVVYEQHVQKFREDKESILDSRKVVPSLVNSIKMCIVDYFDEHVVTATTTTATSTTTGGECTNGGDQDGDITMQVMDMIDVKQCPLWRWVHDESGDINENGLFPETSLLLNADSGGSLDTLSTMCRTCTRTRPKDTVVRSDIHFVKCKNELSMIRSFLRFIECNDIDYTTGWNTDSFDFGYMIEERLKYYDELAIAQGILDEQRQRQKIREAQ